MLDIELERFIAEEGIGIAEMLCVRPPSVCALIRNWAQELRKLRVGDLPRAGGAQRKCPFLGPLVDLNSQAIIP